MKVALYARVSSDKQDVDLSISAQLKALREYAARNGYLIVHEYVDEAESGRTSARPAFREMISLARRPNKPFEQILVWKYSRFARSREDSIVYKTLLRKNGVQVISINEPFEDTPTGRLLEAMIESLDEFYSANLGEEVTRGMRESASRGFYLSARPPYGYRKVSVADGSKKRTKLEVDPEQASVVIYIFDQVLHGKGIIEIARELNQNGTPGPKGNGWTKTGLHFILGNELYIGTLVWGRKSKRGLDPIRVEDACPPIVSKEIFDLVQERMRERAPVCVHPRRVASRYLLSGLAKCGHCGKALVGQDAKGGKFAYYTCGTVLKKGAGACPARARSAAKFEKQVVNEIKERILTPENLTELVKLVNEEMDVVAIQYRDDLDDLAEEISNTNRRLERLYDALETGKLGLDELAPRIRELKRRQEELQVRKIQIECLLSDRRVYLASPDIVTAYVNDLKNLLSDSPLAERKAFIRSFVREIKVTGDNVSLTYTLPPVPDENIEDESVLSTVRYSGRYRT
jgi:site-specific DNA recombinase